MKLLFKNKTWLWFRFRFYFHSNVKKFQFWPSNSGIKVKYSDYFFPFSVLRFKTNKIVKCEMLISKKQSEVCTNFLQSQSYVCSREFGSKPFHVTVPNSHQGYNEYSLKKPPANGYFFVFLFGSLCTWDMFHDTTMKKNGLYVFLPATSEPTQYCGGR